MQRQPNRLHANFVRWRVSKLLETFFTCILASCLPLAQLVGPVSFVSGLEKAEGTHEGKTKGPCDEILALPQALKTCSPSCASRSWKLFNCRILCRFMGAELSCHLLVQQAELMARHAFRDLCFLSQPLPPLGPTLFKSQERTGFDSWDLTQ